VPKVYRDNEDRLQAPCGGGVVTLLVVGGEEKISLRFETVKYGRESQGTETRERLRWQGPAAYTKYRPVLSSERAPHKNMTVTVKASERLDTKTYLLTKRQSQCDFDLTCFGDLPVWRRGRIPSP
jgi:hypothetical protein